MHGRVCGRLFVETLLEWDWEVRTHHHHREEDEDGSPIIRVKEQNWLETIERLLTEDVWARAW